MFHWRGIRKTLSEREDTGSPSGPVILLFPSNKFPFSCLTARLTLFFSAIALQNRCWLVLARQMKDIHFSSIQSLSHVWLLATPWTAARQASLSITNSWSLLKLMTIESVMPSNHLILPRPLFLLPSILPSIRVFPKELALHIRWPKYWRFTFNTYPNPNPSASVLSLNIQGWFL